MPAWFVHLNWNVPAVSNVRLALPVVMLPMFVGTPVAAVNVTL